MYKIVFLFIFTFTSQLLYCQTGWFQIYSSQTDDPDVLFFLNNNTGYAGGSIYVYKTTNGAANWTPTFIDSGFVENICFISSNVGYLSTSEHPYINGPYIGKIFKTTNSGLNWIQKYIDGGNTFSNFKFFSDSVGFALGGRSDYYGLYGHILRTVDGGNSWYQAYISTPNIPTSVSFINQLTGFVSTVSYGNSPILKTTDAGASWTATTVGPGINDFIYLNANRICAIGNNRASIILSTNGGSSWVTKVSGGFFNDICQADSLSLYVVGQNHIIYKTFDKGDHWYLQNPNTTANLSHVYFPTPLTGYISGWGPYPGPQIVMKTTDGGGPVGIINISSNIPDNFSLSQNYPNPFNPSTKIMFDVPKLSFVKLTVFDALGREINTLIDQKLQAGTYETEFDGSDYPSGVYFYKLETDEYSLTKKMILLK